MLFRKLLEFSDPADYRQHSVICVDIAANIEIILNKYRYKGVWSDLDQSNIVPFSYLENENQFIRLVSFYIQLVVSAYESRLSLISIKTLSKKIEEAAIHMKIEGNIVTTQHKFVAEIILEYRLRFKVLA